MVDEAKANHLMQEAYAHLESYNTERAESMGRDLVDMGYSGGYEVLALAFAQDDKMYEAIEILQEGVEKFPHVWLLWQLLGNLQSDLEQFEKAHRAYERALALPDADHDSISLNMAIVFSRENRHQEALIKLQGVNEPDMMPHVYSLRTDCLVALQRFEEALDIAEHAVAEIESQTDLAERSNDQLSRLYASIAVISKTFHDDPDKARLMIDEALSWNKSNAVALRVLRELKNIKSDKNSREYSISVEGDWHEPFVGETECHSFVSKYTVVASSDAEALEFARELEPPAVRNTLRIIDREKGVKVKKDDLKGVYWRSSYFFFEDQDEDSHEDSD